MTLFGMKLADLESNGFYLLLEFGSLEAALGYPLLDGEPIRERLDERRFYESDVDHPGRTHE